MKYILSLLTLSLAIIGSKFNTANNPEINRPAYLKIDSNDTVMKSVLLQEFNNDFLSPSVIRAKDGTNDLNFKVNLAEPKFFRFYSFKPSSVPLLIYVEPGDSVTYKLGQDKSMVFEGKNANQYNFFSTLKNVALYYPNYNDVNEIWKYKKEVDNIYKKKLSALSDYVKAKKVSDLFVKKTKEVFKYEYLNRLLTPEISIQELINNPKYLDGIDYKLFNRNNQENNNYFYLALNRYLHYISALNNVSEEYSNQELTYRLNFIDTHLTGDTKQFAITKTYIDHDEHLRFGNIEFLKRSVIKSLSQIIKKEYREQLELLEQKLERFSSELPVEVLNSKLIDIDGNTVTFQEILNRSGNNIKTIDFWASWCSPCISEIKDSHELRNKLKIEKKVIFLYFSVDSDREKWKSKVADLKKFGMDRNQYFIDGGTYSIIGKYFSLMSIPKYVVLNATNKTYSKSVPSPGSAEFEVVINQVK